MMCSQPLLAEENISDAPNLDITEAIEIANSKLIEEGIELDKVYIYFVVFQDDRKWVIYYSYKTDQLGGRFHVSFDDKENPEVHIAGGA